MLPVLGALPDALIVGVSGFAGDQQEAREHVAVGIGALAGSTVLLLTLAWGGAVLLGQCDLDDKVSTTGYTTVLPFVTLAMVAVFLGSSDP